MRLGFAAPQAPSAPKVAQALHALWRALSAAQQGFEHCQHQADDQAGDSVSRHHLSSLRLCSDLWRARNVKHLHGWAFFGFVDLGHFKLANKTVEQGFLDFECGVGLRGFLLVGACGFDVASGVGFVASFGLGMGQLIAAKLRAKRGDLRAQAFHLGVLCGCKTAQNLKLQFFGGDLPWQAARLR